MKILGISAFYHDSAACLLVDGKVVAAAQEERFSRIKHDAGFPKHAIAYCLQEAGCTMAEIDQIAFHEKPLTKFDRALETFLTCAPRNGPMFWRGMGNWFSEKLRLPERLEEEFAYRGEVIYASHHESHAASAFYVSPFESSAVLTADGVGEWETNTIAHGQGVSLELMYNLLFPHSLGLLYSAFTHYLGFRVNWGEYKVMGLAPYGDPVYRDAILKELVDIREDGSFRLHVDRFAFLDSEEMTDTRFEQVFGRRRRTQNSELESFHMNVARSLQEVTTEILLAQSRFAVEQTGEDRLTLAGGVALNCVANGFIERSGIVKELWIQPAANDAGCALGAALVAWHKIHGRDRVGVPGDGDGMRGAYLGPSYSGDEIEEALRKEGIAWRVLNDAELVSCVSEKLADGEVVGWFQGRMEFGPRALGNRSILADPRGGEMQRRVNEKIKFREGFRPFAPAVLKSKASEWFGIQQESPYMLIVGPVSETQRIERETEPLEPGLSRLYEPRSSIQAVTHVDYSARVQTVCGRENPLFHRLIESFEQRTGTPVVLNTSFNLRGEPVVCTPENAIASFLASGMDTLVLGNRLVPRPEGALPTGRVPPPPSSLFPPKPLSRKKRWIAGTVASAMGVFWVVQGEENPWAWLGSALLFLLGFSAFFLPDRFEPIHRGLERGVRALFDGLTKFLFGVIFYGIVLPIGWIRRLGSPSDVNLRPDSSLSTYWRKASWPSSYKRMF